MTLAGSAKIDATGGAYANAVTGNSGNERIDGGLGSDTLAGQGGLDTFVFASALAASNLQTTALSLAVSRLMTRPAFARQTLGDRFGGQLRHYHDRLASSVQSRESLVCSAL